MRATASHQWGNQLVVRWAAAAAVQMATPVERLAASAICTLRSSVRMRLMGGLMSRLIAWFRVAWLQAVAILAQASTTVFRVGDVLSPVLSDGCCDVSPHGLPGVGVLQSDACGGLCDDGIAVDCVDAGVRRVLQWLGFSVGEKVVSCELQVKHIGQ